MRQSRKGQDDEDTRWPGVLFRKVLNADGYLVGLVRAERAPRLGRHIADAYMEALEGGYR